MIDFSSNSRAVALPLKPPVAPQLARGSQSCCHINALELLGELRRQERLLTACLHSGRTVFNFILHSSELMPGGAPWIRDDAAVAALYDRLRRCIVWMRERAQVRFVTLSRIPRHLLSPEAP